MSIMIKRAREQFVRFLRWTERYTKTDMLYLAQAGWWMNLDIVSSSVISLVLAIIYAHILSPTTYGFYQYLLSISALVAAVSLAGMNSAVTQAVARGYEGVFRKSIGVQLRWAIIPSLMTAIGAVYYFIHGNLLFGFGLVAIALLTPIVNVFNTYGAFLQGKREFRQNFLFSFTINLTYGICIAFAVFLLRNAAVLILVNFGVNALVTFIIYKKTISRYKPNDKIDPAAIPYGKQLSVLSAWGTILTQLDSIMVFHFLGAVNLAIYSFATLLPEKIGGLFNFIGGAALPKFANYEMAHIQKNIISKLVRITVAAIIVILLYIFVAPYIFEWLFPRYIGAIYYSQIYAPIIGLLAVLNVASTALYAKRLKREVYIMGFIQPLLLVAFQLPLLLIYGIMGMLIARMITEIVGIILGLIFIFYPLTKERT